MIRLCVRTRGTPLIASRQRLTSWRAMCAAMRATLSWPRGWPVSGRWSATWTRNSPGAGRGIQRYRAALPRTEGTPPGLRNCGYSDVSCGEQTPVETAVENTAYGCGLCAGDLDVDRGGHLGVEAHLDAVRARGLDRVGDHDRALVDIRAARILQRGRDVGGADRAEQAAGRAGPPVDPEGQLLQPAGHRLRVFHCADLAGRAGPFDQLDLLLATARPVDTEPARHEVVPAVACGHVHHVAGGAEATDFLGQDELHASHWSVPLALASRACVGEERHLERVLDRRGDVALVAGAVPGDPPRAALA